MQISQHKQSKAKQNKTKNNEKEQQTPFQTTNNIIIYIHINTNKIYKLNIKNI